MNGKLTKDSAKELMEYINRYGYFHKGVHCVDLNGSTYRVDGIIKFLVLQGIIK